ncbi:hypothetical protein B9G98_03081 [Wickerhamiella sorbophila]|uniref:Uncharacterized protein n=1 Tax=Wickerhamiella sorbophila TaxID=45607 RepID=A0A2T0FKE1_9ASCO|nr:hypothetical protein B9G98_03081 [Wickerhamiella sorbophila]PRT55461.1 hypothetical protein B9G98_03081 [Wickerhamiella sorbophila]
MGLTAIDQASSEIRPEDSRAVATPAPPQRLETIKNLEAAFRIALDNPTYLAERFHRYVCETMDKSKWGETPDPMTEAFNLVNSQAPDAFYTAFSDSKRAQLLARSRNWMAALIKLRKRDLVAPALDFFLRIPATDAEMLQSKMHPIIRILRKGNDEIARKSELIAQKYHIDPAGPGAATTPKPERKPSPPSEPETSNKGIFSLTSHRRAKVEKPKVQVLPDPPMPVPVKSEQPAPAKHFTLSSLRAQIGSQKRTSPPEEVVEVPVPKKAKSGKRVHWKDDSELVQVKFFETDEVRSHLRSAQGAREMEMDEAASTKRSAEVIPWSEPVLISFDPKYFGDLRALMGVKRGGTKQPDSPEATAQQARESKVLASFPDPNSGPTTPKEPTETAQPEATPTRFPPFKGIPPPHPVAPQAMVPPMGMAPMAPIAPMGMMGMMPVFPMGFNPNMMHMFNNQQKK